MKKILTVILTAVLLLSFSTVCFAAEETDTYTVDVYAKYVGSNDKTAAIVPDDAEQITVELPDGTDVTVEEIPENAWKLVVFPVPETETKAWEWIEDCLKDTADPVHTFDIYFEDEGGNRIDADGAVVTLNCPHCAGVPIVCSLDTDGTVHVLNTSAKARASAVTFVTNGSNYYIMAEELPTHDVEIKEPTGGDVEIDKPDPETGDKVTITPDPDNGKEVDKVVVKDEDGNEIPVKDNGDGTYTYEQPDGDVTIEVTFKDKTTPDSPQTGDTSNLMLWWLLLIVSAMCFVLLTLGQRKRKEMN